MNKVRDISYKIYLTIQRLVILIGLTLFIFNIVALVYDKNVRDQGYNCLKDIPGVSNTNISMSDNKWIKQFEEQLFINFSEQQKKQWNRFNDKFSSNWINQIQDTCKTISISKSLYDTSIKIYFRNMIDSTPFKLTERLFFLTLATIIPLSFLIFLWASKKWIVWLIGTEIKTLPHSFHNRQETIEKHE